MRKLLESLCLPFWEGVWESTLCFIKSNINLIKEKEKRILIQDENLKIYEKWINKIQDGKSIADFFEINHYHSVAIYGMGRIGKQIYRELTIAGVQIKYGIDRVVTHYDKISCYSDDKELPKVDIIVIAVPYEARDIKNDLRKKINCPIQSIGDILFML